MHRMGIFNTPSPSYYVPPLPSAPPPPPSPVDPSMVRAAEQTKARFAAAGGHGSTNPTGGQGVLGPAYTTRKTLLGQ